MHHVAGDERIRADLARSCAGFWATRIALPITSAGRRWPLGPVGMDRLELLSIEGSAFVILDLDVANPALLPLSGDPNDVQDIRNTRPVGGLPGNACEHVYEGRSCMTPI